MVGGTSVFYENNTGLYNAMLGSIGMDRVISESGYKGTILQRIYWKMTFSWSFSYKTFVKFHGKNLWSHNITVFIQICIKTR